MANISDKILATVGSSVPTASMINILQQAEENPSAATQSQAMADVLLYDLQAAAGILSLIVNGIAVRTNVLLTLTAMLNDTQKILRSYSETGTFKLTDLRALASDSSALVSIAATAGAGAAAGTVLAPVLVGVATTSAILSILTGLGAYAVANSGQDAESLGDILDFKNTIQNSGDVLNYILSSSDPIDSSTIHLVSLNTIKLSKAQILAFASQEYTQIGVEYRYWLEELTPVIKDSILAGLTSDLTLYNSKIDSGNISSMWIKDRTEMLFWLYEQYAGGAIEEGRFLIYKKDLKESWRFNDIKKNLVVNAIGTNNQIINQVRFGTKEDEWLFGAKDEDHLYGMAGNDHLRGLGGNDYLEGGKGNDDLDGGEGHDVLLGMSDNDTLDGGAGNDYLHGGTGNDDLTGGAGNDILIGGKGVLKADGSEGNDLIYSDSQTANADNILAGDGNDIVESYDGDDAIAGEKGNDILIGGKGKDLLSGGEGNDYLLGGEGIDTLMGQENSDYLQGGEGADDYVFNGAFGSDLIDDTDGTIKINDAALVISGYDDAKKAWNGTNGSIIRRMVSEDGGQQAVIISDSSESNHIFINNFQQGNLGLTFSEPPQQTIELSGNTELATAGNNIIFGKNNVQAADGDDYVSGTEGTDKLYGGGDDDWLSSNNGDDLIDGGEGNDVILGGKGSDILYGSDGDDIILSSVRFRYTTELIGLMSSTVSGDMLEAEYGYLKYAVEKDYHEPTKTYTRYFNSTSNNPLLLPQILGRMFDYTDEVANFDIGATYLQEYFLQNEDTDPDRAYGGKGNDFIIGSSGADSLYGNDDNDYLYGRAGSDSLYGGQGKDEIDGGEGIDLLDGGTESDVLIGGYESDVLFGGGGDDKLIGDLSNVYPSNLLPPNADKTRYGSDLLHGGAGNDYLTGGGGDDFLYGDDDHDQLVGDEGNDYLFGGQGDDFLYGDSFNLNETQAGNDIMDGGIGKDALFGGLGDDILKGGSDKDQLFGDEGNDILQGGDDADDLYAGSGDDILEGGKGDDKLFGGKGDDIYIFNIGDGVDTITEEGVTVNSLSTRNFVYFKFNADQIKQVTKSGMDLVIKYGTSDQVTVKNYYATQNTSNAYMVDPDYQDIEVAAFYFDDGTVWDTSAIMEMAPPPPPEEREIPPSPLDGVPYFIDALVSREDVKTAGKKVITFGFASKATTESDFSLFTPEQIEAIKLALNQFAQELNIEFVESNDLSRDLTFFMDDLTSADSGAAAGYASSATGEIHLNSRLFKATEFQDNSNSLNRGQFGFEVLLHEIGHALGLKHPFEPPVLPTDQDNQHNTIMSYTDNNVIDTSLKMFDIAALQYLYGVNSTLRDGNNVYNFTTHYIADGGGYDVFNASTQTLNVFIDINQGRWSFVDQKNASILADNQTFIGYGTIIEAAFGGEGNDKIIGNNTHNHLEGGTGDDSLTGGRGNDILLGGEGVDHYYFAKDAFGTGDGQDQIIDIDADTVIHLDNVSLNEIYQYEGIVYYSLDGDGIKVDDSLVSTWMINGQSYNPQEFRALYADIQISNVSFVVEDLFPRGILAGTENNNLTGNDQDNQLFGNQGNNIIDGAKGNDSIYGAKGDDSIKGGEGNDTLDGGEGNDILNGEDGDDRIDGGKGSDSIEGGIGKDTIDGGQGDDTLKGGQGNDKYVISYSDGKDTIIEDDVKKGMSNSQNTVEFEYKSTEVTNVIRVENDLKISFGVSNSVTVVDYYDEQKAAGLIKSSSTEFVDANTKIAAFYFADGVVWDTATILSMAPPPNYDLPLKSIEDIPYFINALVSREYNELEGKTIIGYSFATQTTNEMGGAIFSDEQIAAIGQALNKFAEILNVKFEQSTDADLTFFLDNLINVDDALNTAGYLDSEKGEIHLNSDLFSGNDSLNFGTHGFEVLLHEIGHALGLKHPSEYPVLPIAENTQNNTVMSYVSNNANDTELKLFDIAALQYLYGVNSNINMGSNQYDFTQHYISDGAGYDVFNASTATSNVTLNLNQGGWSFVGQKQNSIFSEGQTVIGYGTIIEAAIGGEGNDKIMGNQEHNYLEGGLGDDSLIGGMGNDVLLGGEGSDHYYFSQGDGRDQIIETNSNHVIHLNEVSLESLYYINQTQTLYYGSWNDSIQLDFNLVANWEINGNYYSSQELQSIFNISNVVSEDNIQLTEQQMNAILMGSTAADIIGNNNNNTLLGNSGKNYIFGDLGNDTLIGGKGDDTLNGGLGFDTYTFNEGDGSDTITGENLAQDVLSIKSNSSNVEFTRDSLDLIITLISTQDEIRVVDYFSDQSGTNGIAIKTLDNKYYFYATVNGLTKTPTPTILDDNFRIGSIGEIVDGLLGHDTVRGSLGNDTIYGNTGDDVLLGGRGDDLIDGGEGKDYLDGGTGNNTLIGGLGGDTYHVYNNQTLVIENENSEERQGTSDPHYYNDTIVSSVDSLVLPEYIEDLRLSVDNVAVTGFGNDANNSITGNANNNYLYGANGNDVLWGMDGSDTLFGEDGNDVLYGNNDNDTLDGGTGDDSLEGGLGTDVLIGGEGNDSYHGDIGETTIIHDEDGSGYIWFSEYSLLHNQTPSVDYFFRSIDGNPWGYTEDDINHFYKDVNITYQANLQKLSITGLDGLTQLVFTDLNSLDPLGSLQYTLNFSSEWVNTQTNEVIRDQEYQLYDLLAQANVTSLGSDDDDYIQGLSQSGTNTIYAGAGNDTLSGGDGDDLLEGGVGNDEVYARDGQDTLDGGDGDDLLDGGTGNDSLLGGEGDDTLLGGNGEDVLVGGAGNNVLRGGYGNDTYYINSLNDQIIETNSYYFDYSTWTYYWSGFDTIIASIDYQLGTGSNIEGLTLLENTEARVAIGNELYNHIEGNSANNLLQGLQGGDALYGFVGNDTLQGGVEMMSCMAVKVTTCCKGIRTMMLYMVKRVTMS